MATTHPEARFAVGARSAMPSDAELVTFMLAYHARVEAFTAALLDGVDPSDARTLEPTHATVASQNATVTHQATHYLNETGRIFEAHAQDDPEPPTELANTPAERLEMRYKRLCASHVLAHSRESGLLRTFKQRRLFMSPDAPRNASKRFTAASRTSGDGGATAADFGASNSVLTGGHAPRNTLLTMMCMRAYTEAAIDPRTGQPYYSVVSPSSQVQNRVFSHSLPPLDQKALARYFKDTSTYFPDNFVAVVDRPAAALKDARANLYFTSKVNVCGAVVPEGMVACDHTHALASAARNPVYQVRRDARDRQHDRTEDFV